MPITSDLAAWHGPCITCMCGGRRRCVCVCGEQVKNRWRELSEEQRSAVTQLALLQFGGLGGPPGVCGGGALKLPQASTCAYASTPGGLCAQKLLGVC